MSSFRIPSDLGQPVFAEIQVKNQSAGCVERADPRGHVQARCAMKPSKLQRASSLIRNGEYLATIDRHGRHPGPRAHRADRPRAGPQARRAARTGHRDRGPGPRDRVEVCARRRRGRAAGPGACLRDPLASARRRAAIKLNDYVASTTGCASASKRIRRACTTFPSICRDADAATPSPSPRQLLTSLHAGVSISASPIGTRGQDFHCARRRGWPARRAAGIPRVLSPQSGLIHRQ